MPASLSIGAFVLGAVLLLIALLKGGFKIFGAEVSGTAGSSGRVIAFILGLVFVIVGFSVSDSDKAAVAAPSPSAPEVARSDAPVQSPAQIPAPAEANGTLQMSLDANGTRRLNLRWDVDGNAMQSLLAQLPLTDEHKTGLFVNALATGMDVYAARVTITNTGNSPVSFLPGRIRVRDGSGGDLVAQSLDRPGFLGPTVIGPNQYVQGLMLFQAPITDVALGKVLMSYEDPEVRMSYVR